MSSDLPDGWRRQPLETLCERVSVGHVGETSSFFTESAGVPFIRSQNVRPNRVDLSDIKFITKDFHAKSKKSQLRGGDLLVVRVGQNRGDCAVLPEGLGEVNCANIVFARPDRKYSNFLGAYFNTPKGHDALLAVSSGSAQLVLNTKAVAKIEVPVPPPAEAEAIGDLSRIFDDRITLLRETNATLEAIAQALFKSWFVDFDPVRAKQEGRAPEGDEQGSASDAGGRMPIASMDEATAALFPDSFEESELGLVPRGWRVVPLADVANNQSTTFNFTNVHKAIFINTGDVSDGQFLHASYSVTDSLPGQAKKAILENDILFSEIRPKNKRFAFVNFNPREYVVSTKFMVLRAINGMNPRYLYQILRQSETIEFFNMIAESRSGTFPQITFDSIKNFKLIRPSDECISKFMDCMEPLFYKIDLINKQQEKLEELRDTLLPRLISGKLRLPEAQAQLEDALA